MPRSRFVEPLVRAFEILIAPLWALHFAAVHIALTDARPIDETHALLLRANHVSWWDGFLLRAVQRRLRRNARLTTVMTDIQLERFPFFRWMGAVGLAAGSVASVRSLMKTIADTRRRDASRTVVAFFPQGRIWPSSRRPLGVRRGALAVARCLAPVTIVPVALHIEPLTNVRPHAFVLIGRPFAYHADLETRSIDDALADTLDRLQAFLEEQGEDAPRRWPTEQWTTASPRPSRRPSCRAAR